ncbi:MAG TPA: 2'-5' RNA ligase family protein [Candidatus Dormibacteraeota bacterium]|jgi:2'-5' RNA ligase|nr:2'-5' RNA ligase family protein [Candidatus Dormibacteraeota bacterium]
MPAADWEAESAIILPVPEAEALVQPIRAEGDALTALGVPAHITILYPFAPPTQISQDDLVRLARLFFERTPFRFQLANVASFPDAVYLTVEPQEAFRELTALVVEAYPQYLPYGGRHPDSTPHLTIHTASSEALTTELKSRFEGHLPIEGYAKEAWLMEKRPDDRWAFRAAFPFGS